MFATKVFFSGSNRWKSLGTKSRLSEIPTVVLEFSPGMLGLCGVCHCHDEAVPILPVGLNVVSELHPEASIKLHRKMQNSHFHHASENGLTELPENPKT
jgi:hypothetical protein